MAGSYSHITDDAGRFAGAGLIDNGGDAYEALEECYGMIWWLADQVAAMRWHDEQVEPTREQTIDIIRQAVANYRDGLEIGGRV